MVTVFGSRGHAGPMALAKSSASLGSSATFQLHLPFLGNVESVNLFNTGTDGWIMTSFSVQYSALTYTWSKPVNIDGDGVETEKTFFARDAVGVDRSCYPSDASLLLDLNPSCASSRAKRGMLQSVTHSGYSITTTGLVFYAAQASSYLFHNKVKTVKGLDISPSKYPQMTMEIWVRQCAAATAPHCALATGSLVQAVVYRANVRP